MASIVLLYFIVGLKCVVLFTLTQNVRGVAPVSFNTSLQPYPKKQSSPESYDVNQSVRRLFSNAHKMKDFFPQGSSSSMLAHGEMNPKGSVTAAFLTPTALPCDTRPVLHNTATVLSTTHPRDRLAPHSPSRSSANSNTMRNTLIKSQMSQVQLHQSRVFPDHQTKNPIQCSTVISTAWESWSAAVWDMASFIARNTVGIEIIASSQYSIVLLYFLWISFLFFIKGEVLERYFTPTMVRLTALLRIPDAVAGCTLLAFANGSGDLVSGIVCALYNPEELQFFGTLLLKSRRNYRVEQNRFFLVLFRLSGKYARSVTFYHHCSSRKQLMCCSDAGRKT